MDEKRNEPDRDVQPAASMIEDVARWAAFRDDILGLALAGSHARGTAGADSDIDFTLVCSDPARYLTNTDWVSTFGEVTRVSFEDWGKGPPNFELQLTRPPQVTLCLMHGRRYTRWLNARWGPTPACWAVQAASWQLNSWSVARTKEDG